MYGIKQAAILAYDNLVKNTAVYIQAHYPHSITL